MRTQLSSSQGAVRDRLGVVRHDWTRDEVRALFALPFPDLMYEAQRIHRMHFDPREVQISTLLSIKTGGCPEDCAYCPQSVHYDTGVPAAKLMDLEAVLAEARAAKAAGASRFCMGEGLEDRVGMVAALANLPAHPENVPINVLVRVEGTPLARRAALDPIAFVRTIAVARIAMPASVVRLSAGREDMSEETQALCFLAGANSIFYGPKLLTTPNPEPDRDARMFDKLGIVPMADRPPVT